MRNQENTVVPLLHDGIVLCSSCLTVVNLATHLTPFIAPREVCHWDEEEGVAWVGNTSECIVPIQRLAIAAQNELLERLPGSESGDNAKSTTSLDTGLVWLTARVGEITDSEHEECHV